MIIEVDPSSATPPYEQLRAQVAALTHSGVLVEGARLPPIRQLARDLNVAAGTVARAYRELEREGVIRTRGRHGTFVVRTATMTSNERTRRLNDLSQRFAIQARQLGATDSQIAAALRRALR